MVLARGFDLRLLMMDEIVAVCRSLRDISTLPSILDANQKAIRKNAHIINGILNRGELQAAANGFAYLYFL